MKLLNSLFTVLSHTAADNRHDFCIRLDAEHFIYKAHFPGEPITPGVCIMQMAMELMEKAVGKPLDVKCVKNVKFLRIITPTEVAEVCYTLQKLTIEEQTVKSQIVVSAGDDVYAKLSLICEIQSQDTCPDNC